MDERLSAQLAFLLEADRLKQIERQSLITGTRRRENTAEHSWHLALFALVLSEHADEDIDLARVVAMVVLHDLVEIDAGDTYAYDDAGYATKVDREQHAADRLFGLLPEDQGTYLRGLWEEYEAARTPDARFANALDRLQPVLLNHATDGATWAVHGVTADRVRARNSVIAQASAGLWAAALARIDDAVAKGWISEPE
jgi:putative hydrolase of HD superfamily